MCSLEAYVSSRRRNRCVLVHLDLTDTIVWCWRAVLCLPDAPLEENSIPGWQCPWGPPLSCWPPRHLAPLSLTTLSKIMLPCGNRPQPNTDWPRDINAWLSTPSSRQICRLISSSESLLPQLRPPLSQLSSLCLILLSAQPFSFSSVDPKSMPSELASMQKSISACC